MKNVSKSFDLRCRHGFNRFSRVGYEGNKHWMLMANAENYTWYAYQEIIIYIERFKTCSGDFIGFVAPSQDVLNLTVWNSVSVGDDSRWKKNENKLAIGSCLFEMTV